VTFRVSWLLKERGLKKITGVKHSKFSVGSERIEI